MIKKLSSTLSINSLLTIYKAFFMPIVNYADIIYAKPLTESFNDELEMVRYNAAFVITGAIKGTSSDRIYRELSLESLAERRRSHKISFVNIIINVLLSVYLQAYISYCGEDVYCARSPNQTTLDNSLQEKKHLS